MKTIFAGSIMKRMLSFSIYAVFVIAIQTFSGLLGAHN